MLNEKEKLQLLKAAESKTIQKDFRNCKRKNSFDIEKNSDLNWYLSFLTVFSKIFSKQKRESMQFNKPDRYSKILL